MKILIVQSIYRPYKKGGAEVVVERFVDELKKKHEVFVLTTKKRGTCDTEREASRYRVLEEGGVTVIRFVPFNIFSIHGIDKKPFWLRVIWHAIDVWNIHSWFVMRRVLKMHRPDVVWTHTMKGIGYLPMKAITGYASRVTRHAVRWILTPHSEELIYQFGYGKYPFKIGVVERVTMFFTGWFTKGVDLVLAPSKQIIELHEKYGFWNHAEKISLWPCFIAKKDLVLPQPATFTFGFIGQIEEHKGIRELIKAFKSYQNQNVRLFVAGRGNLATWVHEQTKNNPRIEFYGVYHQEELETLFSKISVLVVPSLIRDNMPTVILEAFTHSRPVIGSPLGGIPEILGFQNSHCEESDATKPASPTSQGGQSSNLYFGLSRNDITHPAVHFPQERGRERKIVTQSLVMTQKGLLLKGFEEQDFHEAFDEIQKPEVYQKLVGNIKNWKPVTIQEVLEKIGF